MRLFRKLRRRLDYLDEDQIAQTYKAYQIAAEAHKTQKRYSGDAYITHPVAAACILADLRMDHKCIMAALLHDVLEDTVVDKATLVVECGEKVADIVDGVSKLSQIEVKTRAEAQAEYLRKMVLAMSKDIRVIIVKLADRLHNMRTIKDVPLEKQKRIAKETLDIFAPIANRLGMRDISVELEDLAFSALYPGRYAVLKESVQRARGHRKEILVEIEKNLKKGLKAYEFSRRDITGREKNLHSIYKKMRSKQMSFSQIMDVYAFRIVVDSNDDCYRALGVTHGIYKPVPERFKDYIAIPKANGYQALHTTLFGPHGVPVEIQIRTKEMDERATSGIAAHWLYKSSDESIDHAEIRAHHWVANLLEMQKSAGNSLEFIENVKFDLFSDEVYVFTPKGGIMELPKGATAIDFAYAVHTDVGDTCVAAKIDRQLSPLSTALLNGQTVEIITSPSALPNSDWLSFVITGKARSSIRHALKNRRQTESVALGRQLLNRALESVKLSLKRLSLRKVPDEVLQQIANEDKLGSVDELFEEIGLGNSTAMLIAHRIAKIMELTSGDKQQVEIEEPQPLLIRGTEGVVVEFADCCNPIPGDPIVSLFKAGQGMVVHAENCRRLAHLTNSPDGLMPVRWDEQVQGEFLVTVMVELLNQRGSLATMSLAISEAGANIDDIHIDERDEGRYKVTFQLLVRNRAHLANVIRRVRGNKSIIKISRSR